MDNANGYQPLIVDGVKILESRRVDLTAVSGYAVPVDPAGETQCDSCQ